MKIVSHFPLAPAGRRHRARSRASITRPRAAQISRLAELPSISFARTNSRIDRCLFRMGDNQSHYQGRREKRPTSLPVRNDGRGPSRGSRKSSRWKFLCPWPIFFSQRLLHTAIMFSAKSPSLLFSPPLLCLPPFFRRPSRRFPPPPNRRRFSLVSARACDRSLRPARHGVSGQRGIARRSLGLS